MPQSPTATATRRVRCSWLTGTSGTGTGCGTRCSPPGSESRFSRRPAVGTRTGPCRHGWLMATDNRRDLLTTERTDPPQDPSVEQEQPPGVLRKAIAASAVGNATEWFDYG